jgi:glycosyltransferase involved in cell wall biosynthesis
METKLPNTLFLSRGNIAAGWYRCALPALALGFEWVCYQGDPPRPNLAWGKTDKDLSPRDLESYDVLIMQQPAGQAWARQIREWRSQGIVVLYDIDDDIYSIRRKRDHDFADKFSKKKLEQFEIAMRACDGVICSTERLARRYAKLNPNTYVAENGIDFKRYALTVPERDYVGVGWAGGTGHREAVVPWLRELVEVMRQRDHVRFFSVGQRFADELKPEFGEQRAMSVPFSSLDVYPSAMANYDISLAPAGEGNFYRGKSDLRWLEASAIGLPTIAHPGVYPQIEHGVTGFHADSPAEMREILETLIADAELRRRIGKQAKEYVWEHRSAQATSRQWAEILETVSSSAAAA